jgi:capsid protein
VVNGFLKQMEVLAKHILNTAQKIDAPKAYIDSGGAYRGYGFTGAKWPEGLSGDGVNPAYNNYSLRANGRTAYQDSTHAETIAKRSADMITGIGLKFFSSPDFKTLGITKEQAQEIGDKITRLFHSYSLSKKQSRDGLTNLYQDQRRYQLCNNRDGEEFIRLYYSKDRQLLNPVQFNLIDANQIQGDAITDNYLPYNTKDGINRNDKGEEISYNILNINKDGSINSVTIPRVGEKSKRIFMLHCFAPEFPGQKRGLSKLGKNSQDFQNLEDFIQAHTQKAINESNILLSAENNLQDPSNPTRDQVVPSSAGIALPTSGGTSETASTPEQELICHRPVMPTLKPGSMMFMNLTQGDKLKSFPNTAPSDGFDNFIDTYFSYIAAKNNIPASIATMKFGQSYSASRGELLLYWISVNVERAEMISDFLNPLLEMVLSEEIATGRLSLPGWENPRMRMAWMGGVWYGSAIPSIDPLKEANANLLNLKMSATTLDKISRDLNGSNAESNIAKNKEIFPEIPVLNLEGNSEDENNDDDSDDGNKKEE